MYYLLNVISLEKCGSYKTMEEAEKAKREKGILSNRFSIEKVETYEDERYPFGMSVGDLIEKLKNYPDYAIISNDLDVVEITIDYETKSVCLKFE